MHIRQRSRVGAGDRWRAVWWAFSAVGLAAAAAAWRVLEPAAGSEASVRRRPRPGWFFTTGFALVMIWSQQVFHERPTTGFALAIMFMATGFIVGPSLFGALATRLGRPVALLAVAMPALLVALVPPSPEIRRRLRGLRSVQ